MGLARPTGTHTERMLAAGGWPEADEDTFHDRADQYIAVLRDVDEIIQTCRHQSAEIFSDGIWSGSGATAAETELQTGINGLVTLQDDLTTVITWNRDVAVTIAEAKAAVTGNVDSAERQITSIATNPAIKAAERAAAIDAVVTGTHAANLGLVDAAAERILASRSWQPPSTALADLLNQKTPTIRIDESGEERVAQVHPVPSSAQADTERPGATGSQPSGMVSGGALSPNRSSASQQGRSTAPTAGQPAPANASGTVAPPKVKGDRGVAAASTTTSATQRTERDQPKTETATSAATTGGGAAMPVAPMAPSASGGAAAGAGAGRAGSGRVAPVSQPGSGANTGVRPASAGRSGARPERRQQPARAGEPATSAPASAVPVSAARAERDAIAEATSAGATQNRETPDPLQTARRIAAALSAPDAGGQTNLEFFWLTALTTDGTIVVANSYGVAFIPEGVRLPAQVRMASADDAIPAFERASWATYPVLAVQRWAAHHQKELRAVISTADKLTDSDPGVATIVLEQDDIPDSSDMPGRSRLEVVDPAAARQLAATPDARLASMLPPATTLHQSDEPDHMLWFEVMRTLLVDGPSRQSAHLEAMGTYATTARERCLLEAHSAESSETARVAVAEWLYWQHLTKLLKSMTSPES